MFKEKINVLIPNKMGVTIKQGGAYPSRAPGLASLVKVRLLLN